MVARPSQRCIDNAEREILLEMYWVGTDVVGRAFRDRLRARALAGVAVFVKYDGVGSLGLFRSFWAPLLEERRGERALVARRAGQAAAAAIRVAMGQSHLS